MTQVPREALPDLTRLDSQLVLAGLWTAGTPATQHAAADAALARWEQQPLPAAALSHTCLLGDDGAAIFHYSQWADEEGVEELPVIRGIVADSFTKYRLYRTMTAASAVASGCVVIVSVTFDGPDEKRLRRWVDAVFDAVAADPATAGGLAGHFHVSVDGTRVLNFAEWTDAVSHQRALDRVPGPKWQSVREFPGIVSADVKRFRPYRSVSRTRAAADAS